MNEEIFNILTNEQRALQYQRAIGMHIFLFVIELLMESIFITFEIQWNIKHFHLLREFHSKNMAH